MIKQKILKTTLVLATYFALLSLSISNPVFSQQNADVTQALPESVPSSGIPIEEIKTFVDVFMQIKNRYVDEISDKELIEKAINGMVEGLDPFSEYLGSTSFNQLTSDTKGQFGGVGVQVSLAEGGILVDKPIENSPATDVNIQAGDLIVKLDDKDAANLNLDQAKKIMRGEPGSKLRLLIQRDGELNLLQKTIIRDIIQLETVSSLWLKDDIAYLRLSQFQSASAAKLRDKIFKIKSDPDRKLSGLIFDLRGNPGGLLTSAIAVSDIFLDGGKIVSTKSRSLIDAREYSASPLDITEGVPMVVLVDNGSASAAEIVSGALQDNTRAKIIGEQTFGKGSVQSLINLSDARALKLTTGLYYTPSGVSIHEKGITPDLLVEYVEAEKNPETGKTLNYDSQVEAGINILNSSL